MYFHHLTRHRKLLGLMAADVVLFNVTDARSAPVYTLIVGFVLVMITFYYLLCGGLQAAKLYGVSFKHKRRVAAYVTILAGFLLALQSVGELNSRDVLVLLPLMVIGYGYGAYVKTTTRLPDM